MRQNVLQFNKDNGFNVIAYIGKADGSDNEWVECSVKGVHEVVSELIALSGKYKGQDGIVKNQNIISFDDAFENCVSFRTKDDVIAIDGNPVVEIRRVVRHKTGLVGITA